jgi:hypothetical protein
MLRLFQPSRGFIFHDASESQNMKLYTTCPQTLQELLLQLLENMFHPHPTNMSHAKRIASHVG